MRKTSKKLIALLLVGILAMSMAACGNKAKDTNGNAQNEVMKLIIVVDSLNLSG